MRVGIGPAKFGLKFNFYNNAHKGVFRSTRKFSLPFQAPIPSRMAWQSRVKR
jgi:hypothetical protein